MAIFRADIRLYQGDADFQEVRVLMTDQSTFVSGRSVLGEQRR